MSGAALRELAPVLVRGLFPEERAFNSGPSIA